MNTSDIASSDVLGPAIARALGLPENLISFDLRFKAGLPVMVSAVHFVAAPDQGVADKLVEKVAEFQLTEI